MPVRENRSLKVPSAGIVATMRGRGGVQHDVRAASPPATVTARATINYVVGDTAPPLSGERRVSLVAWRFESLP